MNIENSNSLLRNVVWNLHGFARGEIKKIGSHMFEEKKCTQETIGNLVKKQWNGDTWILTVEYEVSGKKYKVKEEFSRKILSTIGRISVGYHSVKNMKDLKAGAEFVVMYNPNKPKQSYLPDIQKLS